MIVDASAIISILRAEDDAPRHAGALATRELPKRISAANYLEAAIVIDAARDPIASQRFDDLAHRAGIVIEPVTADQAYIARSAYRAFAKAAIIRPD